MKNQIRIIKWMWQKLINADYKNSTVLTAGYKKRYCGAETPRVWALLFHSFKLIKML